MLDANLSLDRLNALVAVGRHYIGGAHMVSIDGITHQRQRPVDRQTGPQAARGSGADIDAAVSAGRSAFESGVWSDLDPAERKTTLLRFAALIRDSAEELALLNTADTGCPIQTALTIDAASAVDDIVWHAELADKQYDKVAPTGPSHFATIRRIPPVWLALSRHGTNC